MRIVNSCKICEIGRENCFYTDDFCRVVAYGDGVICATHDHTGSVSVRQLGRMNSLLKRAVSDRKVFPWGEIEFTMGEVDGHFYISAKPAPKRAALRRVIKTGSKKGR